MFLFRFKLTPSRKKRTVEEKTFTGTWSEFEAKYPGAYLTATPVPTED